PFGSLHRARADLRIHLFGTGKCDKHVLTPIEIMEILHSNILGKGKPLLILHGFLGMSDNWKTLGGQYAENGFQVHLLDQRNHGKSFHSPDFDYHLLANDVKDYMAHHNLTSAYVMGHSMGGKTAMQLATTHPELVSKL